MVGDTIGRLGSSTVYRIGCPVVARLPRPETRDYRSLGMTEQWKHKHDFGYTIWEPKHMSELL